MIVSDVKKCNVLRISIYMEISLFFLLAIILVTYYKNIFIMRQAIGLRFKQKVAYLHIDKKYSIDIKQNRQKFS